MELSIQDLKDLINQPQDMSSPYACGTNYIIRTVTMIYTGKLVSVYDKELVLEDAAWIAETARWYDTLKNGSLSEVEPFPDGNIIISRGAIVDVAVWVHKLPRVQL